MEVIKNIVAYLMLFKIFIYYKGFARIYKLN